MNPQTMIPGLRMTAQQLAQILGISVDDPRMTMYAQGQTPPGAMSIPQLQQQINAGRPGRIGPPVPSTGTPPPPGSTPTPGSGLPPGWTPPGAGNPHSVPLPPNHGYVGPGFPDAFDASNPAFKNSSQFDQATNDNYHWLGVNDPDSYFKQIGADAHGNPTAGGANNGLGGKDFFNPLTGRNEVMQSGGASPYQDPTAYIGSNTATHSIATGDDAMWATMANMQGPLGEWARQHASAGNIQTAQSGNAMGSSYDPVLQSALQRMQYGRSADEVYAGGSGLNGGWGNVSLAQLKAYEQMMHSVNGWQVPGTSIGGGGGTPPPPGPGGDPRGAGDIGLQNRIRQTYMDSQYLNPHGANAYAIQNTNINDLVASMGGTMDNPYSGDHANPGAPPVSDPPPPSGGGNPGIAPTAAGASFTPPPPVAQTPATSGTQTNPYSYGDNQTSMYHPPKPTVTSDPPSPYQPHGDPYPGVSGSWAPVQSMTGDGSSSGATQNNNYGVNPYSNRWNVRGPTAVPPGVTNNSVASTPTTQTNPSSNPYNDRATSQWDYYNQGANG